MIELVSIDVTNFRSFGEAQLAPLGAGQGLTAINGANGTGKSSIATTALLWCLYGVTPDGVTVKSLRRQGSEGEVRVTVTFRHAGNTVVVTRALRGKNDTTSAGITVDDVEQTSVSARTATAWVTDRLGVDAEAFTTAFVIRQKEVDALVRARPAERRALIERLAGIDRLSAALAHAREEARHAATTANAIRVDVDPTEAAAAAVNATDAAATARLAADAADAEAAQTGTQADTATATVAAAETAHAAYTAAQHRHDLTQAAALAATRDHARIASAADGADLLPHAQAAAADARLARENAEQAARAVDRAEQVARTEEARAVEARADADRLADTAAKARIRAINLADEAATESIDPATVAGAKVAAETARNSASVLTAEAGRLAAVLTALQGAVAAGHATCPTCTQGLPHPETLLTGLADDLARKKAEAEAATETARTLTEAADTLSRRADTAGKAAAAATVATTQAEAAESAARDAATRAARAEESAEDAAETAHTARTRATDAADALPALREEEAAALAALRKAENAADAAENLPAAQEALSQAQEALHEAQEALHEAQEGIAHLDLTLLRSDAAAAREAAQAALKVAAETRAAQRLAAAEADHATRRAAEAAEAAEAKQAALAAAEVAQATASALEEFRRDRLARLAPELSEVASDIIATMTEGRYSTVELDEDFTPTLTESATGLQRPTSWLSGGEESAVALALRLAVGDVVAGQQVGLLVLDEVLTAHDKGRRAAVMAAVRALPHRQVITINHASEATDQVDLIAQVLPGEDGSVIEHQAGGTTPWAGGDIALD